MPGSQKDCFGDLDRVFPMGKEGLRSEILDRAPANGMVGRLRRWSEKKALTQLTKQKEGERK
jgi:hypothetical protein